MPVGLAKVTLCNVIVPATPVGPVVPVEPVMPENPLPPAIPVKLDPDAPVGPVVPVEPVKPENPMPPVIPVPLDPVAPVGPVEPLSVSVNAKYCLEVNAVKLASRAGASNVYMFFDVTYGTKGIFFLV